MMEMSEIMEVAEMLLQERPYLRMEDKAHLEDKTHHRLLHGEFPEFPLQEHRVPGQVPQEIQEIANGNRQ